MEVTRRDWLGMASAAGALLLTEPLRASTAVLASSGSHSEAVRRIKAFAAADLAEKGLPGMLVSLAGPNGYGETFGVGFANQEQRIPAAPSQLFQIGSISKSLVGACIFALAARGKLDVHATVQKLLPEYPLPAAPITVAQLLNHSSGLPNTLDSPFAAFPEGRLWTGFEPGSRFSYCNLGYALLGRVIERASGMTFASAMDVLVLKPIGMKAARPVILMEDRDRYATGYTRLREDVPWLPKSELTPSLWLDLENAAGSVAATGPDMIAFLRWVAGVANGRGGGVMPDALARRYGTPVIDAPDFGKGARYSNGLATLDIGDRPSYRHTGGMISFSSAFTVDKATGVGAFASVNAGGAGGYRPKEVTEYAVALLLAASKGEALPPLRLPLTPVAVEKPERFTGRWISAAGALTIAERAGALFVTADGRERPLRAAGRNAFVTDHPALTPYELVFDGADMSVLRLGDRLYGRGRAPAVPPVHPRLAGFAGDYYNLASWDPRQKVFVIGDRVYLGSQRLVEAADGSWRFDEPDLVSERIWFERPAGGRIQQLNFSGMRFDRMSI